MKKFLLFLCSFLLAVTIYADEMPTITLEGVYDSNNNLVEDDYNIGTNSFRVDYSISNYNQDYCFIYTSYDYEEDEDIVGKVREKLQSYVHCDYDTGVRSITDYINNYEAGVAYSFAFISKTDKLNIDNTYEDDWERENNYDKLTKYNEVLKYYENPILKSLKQTQITFESIKDANGNVLTEVNNKYLFDSTKTYYVYFKLGKATNDVTYSYSIEEIDSESRDSQSINPQNDYFIVPLTFNENSHTDGFFLVYFNLNKSGMNYTINDTPDLKYRLTDRKFADVSLKYKNFNKEIDKGTSVATLYSKYYNANNPLVLNINLEEYAYSNNATISFYDVDYNEDDPDPVLLYSKDVTLNNGSNEVIIDDFVPSNTITEHDNYFEVDINGQKYITYVFYSSGEIRDTIYDNSGQILTNSSAGDMLGNVIGQIFRYSKVYNDNFYILYGGYELDDNKEYRYEIKNGENDKNEGYLAFKNPKTIMSGTISGKDLNEKQILANIKFTKEESQLVIFYLYDNDKLVFTNYNKFSFHPDDLTNVTCSLKIDNNVSINSYEYAFREYFIRENKKITFVLKGTEYENDTNYFYYISGRYKIASGDITGKELNDGKEITIDLSTVPVGPKDDGFMDVHIYSEDNKIKDYAKSNLISYDFVKDSLFDSDANNKQFINSSQELLSAASGLSYDTAKLLINENNQQEDPGTNTTTPDNPTNPSETNTTIPDNPTNPGETNTTPEEPKPVEPTPVSTETLQKANINVTKSEENSVIVTIENYYINQRYVLEKSTDNKKWKSIADFSANAIRIYDLKFGQKTYFRVRTELNGTKANSNTVNITVKPNTVSNIRISSAGSTNIKVAWDKAPYTGYELQRSTKPTSGFKKVTLITKSKTTSYNNKRLKKATKYYYRVRTYKTVSGKKIYSGWSEVVSAVTGPSTPKKPSIKATNYETIELNLKGTKTATKYDIQRSTKKNKGYTKIATVTELKFIDTVNTGTTYYYRVRACNDNNVCSGWTKYVSKKTSLSKPSITLNTTDIGKIELTHNAIAGADGYEIQKSTKSAKKGFKKAGESVELTFTEEGLKSGKKVYYKVRAYRIINGKRINGPWSKVLNKKVQ